MSQFYIGVTAGSIPPAVPMQFTADDATVGVPVANNYNILSRDTTDDNSNGIQTTVDPNGSDSHYIELTNRVQGTATTVGASTGDIITFTPSVVGTYAFEFRIAAYNTTSSLGAGASVFGAIRFDGVNTNICDLFDEINNDEGAMSGTDLAVVASGASMILRATGYAAQTINWGAVGLYTFVGV